MIVVYPSCHVGHVPPSEIFNGNREPHAEVPDRIEHILFSVRSIAGTRCIEPKPLMLSRIEAVHDPAYIRYLAAAAKAAGSAYVYPSVFPFAGRETTKNPVALRGQYTFDLYTPVSNTTYRVACDSAMAAVTAASLVSGGENVSYALCRPPGHHAEYARMGGYCYFNNAAIAAEYLRRRGNVAVLDIDVHHGNGTQHIFYGRSDILTVSIHADPASKFPYFSGNANERGSGRGKGYNINYPLPVGTDDRAYQPVLLRALSVIRRFAPRYLVVSVGYDAHELDPIGGLRLTTGYYRRMAATIAALGIPTVLVQEGGYNTEKLGEVAKTFVLGFLGTD